jgi:hypothetical protein
MGISIVLTRFSTYTEETFIVVARGIFERHLIRISTGAAQSLFCALFRSLQLILK